MRTKFLLNKFQNSIRPGLRLIIGRILLFLALSHMPCALSQVPQGFNYQAIARDGSGNPITNATIKVMLSVLSDTAGFYASGTGTYVWEEEQTDIKTNAFGLFTIVFGNPSATKITANCAVASFSAIDWARQLLFIGTKIANPSTYKIMGSARLWSVPYAMVSDSSKALLKGQKVSVVSGNDNTSDALFEVRRKDGQPVFAVYSEGVRIYVDDGTYKGTTKGGFAIGGFGGDKSTPQNYFVVSADSIRAYLKSSPGGKGATKGGFAIGGFEGTKTPTHHEYLRVTRDSTRLSVNQNNTVKGTMKGGFAIGGFDAATKTAPFDFLDLTPSNYFLGQEAGKSITSGLYNFAAGYQSGKALTYAMSNAFMGYQAGYSDSTGNNNVLIGYQAGLNNAFGEENVAVGAYAGQLLGNGCVQGDNPDWNTFIGYKAGQQMSKGNSNVMIGAQAGKGNNTSVAPSGSNNIMIGNMAGMNSTSANNNVFLGMQAGYTNSAGEQNIFIGNSAGLSSTDSYNIFIGYWTGKGNTTGSENTFVGEVAGMQNGSGKNNVFIGAESGSLNTGGTEPSGNYNTFLGVASGLNNVSGYNNVYLGYKAGRGDNAVGYNNSFLGTNSGQNIENGYENTYMGYESGYSNISGHGNVAIGTMAGFSNNGNGNVFIGNSAGSSEPSGSNKLYIDNSNTSSPLIYGEFDTRTLLLNANVGIGTSGAPAAKLDINGTVKVGTNGTALTKILKAMSTVDLGSIAANSSLIQTFTVTNAAVGSSVMVSPASDLADGLEIAYARVSSAGTVTVKFRNVSATAIDPPGMDFYITVIE